VPHPPPDQSGLRPSRWRPAFAAIALVAAIVVAYWPALGAGWVWDDDYYVTRNPWLSGWTGLRRLWTPGNTPQYYPLVFTTFWIEHALWGLAPLGYHLVNVLLHAANALLVVRLCRRLEIPGAFLIGALFALHPVHVESVAWVTERKNVLSALFYLLAFLAWLRFDAPERDGAGRPWRWYALTFVCFVAALLAKTVTCSLPAALILAMLWQRRPLTARRLLPLVPMFLVGVLLALQTARIEHDQVGAGGIDFDFSFAERLLIAIKALLFYPSKLLWPEPLTFVYPRWQLLPADPLAWLPALVIALAAIAVVIAWRRGVRGPLLALAFTAGTLFPALGFVNVYPMRFSFVADHFQYLASLGVFALVAAAWCRWVRPPAVQQVLRIAVLATCAVLTWRQAQIYHDATTLWQDTVAVNPGAWMAHNNLAVIANAAKHHQEALEHLQRALAVADGAKTTRRIRQNIAATREMMGQHEAALREYQELRAEGGGLAVEIAEVLDHMGRDAEAETFYRQAVEGPVKDNARIAYAKRLLRRGRAADAAVQLENHLAGKEDDLDARLFLADAYAAASRNEDAVATLRRAIDSDRASCDAPLRALIEQRLQQLQSRPARPERGGAK